MPMGRKAEGESCVGRVATLTVSGPGGSCLQGCWEHCDTQIILPLCLENSQMCCEAGPAATRSGRPPSPLRIRQVSKPRVLAFLQLLSQPPKISLFSFPFATVVCGNDKQKLSVIQISKIWSSDKLLSLIINYDSNPLFEAEQRNMLWPLPSRLCSPA